MRVAAEARHIEAQGLGESVSAVILMGPKFTRIFSDQIYSDKPLAIVGELCANAWDSHRQAGKADVPFILKLPTPLEKSLRISDYGVGMTHEFMMQHFMVMLHSPKDQDDFAAGGFGLGRFTPMAYSDSFVVQCREAGQMRRYMIYKNETGVPSLSFVGTVPTLEPDGVDVIMDIAEPDIAVFHDAARFIAAFIGQPNMTIIGAKIPDLEWRMRTETYGFFDPKKLPAQYQHKHVAVVGPRAYPINAYHVAIPHLLEKKNGVAMFFGIGDVEITPSREHVSYTSNTKTAIEQVAYEAAKNIGPELLAELESKNSFIEAFNFWYSDINSWTVRNALGDDFVNKASWHGTGMDEFVQLQEEVTKIYAGDRTISWKYPTTAKNFGWPWVTQNTDRTAPPKLVLMDSKTAYQKTIRDYAKTLPRYTGILLFQNEADIKTFTTFFHQPFEYEKISDLRAAFKPQKSLTTQRVPTPMLVYSAGSNTWDSVQDIDKYISDHPNTTFYTVETNRGMVVGYDNDRVNIILQTLSTSVSGKIGLIGVPRSKASWIRKLKLGGFEDYVRQKVALLELTQSIHTRANLYLDYHECPLPNHCDEFLKELVKCTYLTLATRNRMRAVLSRQRLLNAIDYNAIHNFYLNVEALFLDVTLQRWTTPNWVTAWRELDDEFSELFQLIKLNWSVYWWNDYQSDIDFKRAKHIILTYLTTTEALHGCLSAV